MLASICESGIIIKKVLILPEWGYIHVHVIHIYAVQTQEIYVPSASSEITE